MRTKYFKYIAEQEARRPSLSTFQNGGGGILQNSEDAYNFLVRRGAVDPNIMSLQDFNLLTLDQKRAIFESPEVRAILENKTPGQIIRQTPIDTGLVETQVQETATPGEDCKEVFRKLWRSTKEGDVFIDPCTNMPIKRITGTKKRTKPSVTKPLEAETKPTQETRSTTTQKRIPMGKSQSGGMVTSPMNQTVGNEMFNRAAFLPDTFSPVSTASNIMGVPNVDLSSMPSPLLAQQGSFVGGGDDEVLNYLNDLDIYVERYGIDALREFPEQFADYLEYMGYDDSTMSAPPGYLKEIIFSKKRLKSGTKSPIKSFISENNSPEYSPEEYGESIGEGILKVFQQDILPSAKSGEGMKSVDISALLKNIYKKLSPGVNIKEPMGVFKNGGSVVSPSYSRYLPVGNSKKVTGYLPMDSMIPIQTEEGELIVHPTMDVTKVNATKRHNKMKDDEVTDVVPEGSYILSRHGVVKIYKDEADKRVIETQNSPYNIHSTNKPPTVKTLGDFMTKKEMSPAEVANSVLKKYKIVDNNDPFTDQTNRSNKYTASKYIKAIVDLSEFDKSRKGIAGGQDMSQMYSMNPQASAKNGGNIYRRPNVSMQQTGGSTADLVGQLLSTGAGLYTNWQNRRLAKQMRERGLQRAREFEDTSKDLLSKGLIPALGALGATDIGIDYAKSGDQYISGILNTINSRQAERALASDLAASAPDLSMFTPQQAAALADQAYAKRLQAQSNFSLEQSRDRADRFAKYLTAMQAISDKNELARIDALNKVRANRNAILSQAGSLGSAYFGDLLNAAANRAALEMGAETGYLQNLSNLNTNRGQILMSQLPGLTSQIYNYANNRNTPTTVAPSYGGYTGDPNNPYGYDPTTGRGINFGGISGDPNNPYGYDPVTGRGMKFP